MTDHDDNNAIEQILRAYRPAGPPESLRRRVLSTGHAQPSATPPRPWGAWAFRAAIAAMLVAAFALNVATDNAMATLAANIGVGPVRWTEDAEQAAQLLDGDGWGRRYIALGLMAGPATAPDNRSLGDTR